MPPPSKSVVLDSPGTELAMPPDAPVVEPPIPADAPVIGLPIPVDAAVVGLPMAAGADEAPAHGAPIKGAAPDVVGLTPGVARGNCQRSVASMVTLMSSGRAVYGAEVTMMSAPARA
jgi:hypothetical protein